MLAIMVESVGKRICAGVFGRHRFREYAQTSAKGEHLFRFEHGGVGSVSRAALHFVWFFSTGWKVQLEKGEKAKSEISGCGSLQSEEDIDLKIN